MFAGIAFPASTFQSAMGTWHTELAILPKPSMRATFAKPAQVSCLAMFAGTANAAISSFFPMLADTSHTSCAFRTSYSSLGRRGRRESCIKVFPLHIRLWNRLLLAITWVSPESVLKLCKIFSKDHPAYPLQQLNSHLKFNDTCLK